MKAHRVIGFVGAAMAAWLAWPAPAAIAQVENAVRRESTARATVDRIEPVTRVLVFHTPNALAQSVYVQKSRL